MKTNVFTRVLKISLAACLALVLGAGFADAGHYGRGYSHNYRPSHYGHGQRSYCPPQYGGCHRPPQHCRPHDQPRPHYGHQGGYGRYR